MKTYPKRKQGKLPSGGPVRHTHATANGLEDALAVAWDIILESERALAFIGSRTRRLVEILQSVRSGPYAYKDHPAGPRTYKVRSK